MNDSGNFSDDTLNRLRPDLDIIRATDPYLAADLERAFRRHLRRSQPPNPLPLALVRAVPVLFALSAATYVAVYLGGYGLPLVLTPLVLSTLAILGLLAPARYQVAASVALAGGDGATINPTQEVERRGGLLMAHHYTSGRLWFVLVMLGLAGLWWFWWWIPAIPMAALAVAVHAFRWHLVLAQWCPYCDRDDGDDGDDGDDAAPVSPPDPVLCASR